MNLTTSLLASLLLLPVAACTAETNPPTQPATGNAPLTTSANARNLLANGELDTAASWDVSGGARTGYAVTPSSTEKHGGNASLLLAPSAGPVPGYATVMQAADATSVRGKHVHAQIWAKLEGTFSRTDFWVRARNTAGGDGPMLGARAAKLEANGEWKRYDLDLDIPDTATAIDFGAGVVGDGKLWIDDAVLIEAAAPPPAPFAFANGDLESGETSPSGWFISGGGRETFDFVRANEAHGGKTSGQLKGKTPGAAGYATAMQVLDARAARGKHVRATVWARTQGATGRVDVWTRARAEGQGGDGPMLGSAHAKPAADTDWKSYILELDVPETARFIDFGVGLGGPGTVWFDDATVEIQ